MNGVVFSWLAFVAVATLREETGQPTHLPPPSIYMGAAVVYSVLGLVSQGGPNAAKAAGVFGGALVVAALVSGSFLPPSARQTTTTKKASTR